MKTWHKVALGVLTVGVTATVTFYAVKAIKKKLADKKKAEDGSKPVPKIDLKKDIPPRKVQLISNLQNTLKQTKMDVFKGVPDANFNRLSEQEVDHMTSLVKKYLAAGGETNFKKQAPKDFEALMVYVNRVIK